MNWRLFVGLNFWRIREAATVYGIIPKPLVPRGRYWLYDIKRFSDDPVNLIFDIGANTGQTSLKAVRFIPKATIYAFEPSKDTFAELIKNTQNLKNVHCFQLAFGGSVGYGQLRLREFTQHNTLIPTDDEFRHTIGVETVKVDTVDNFCEQHSIKSLDVLKMDVQGYELHCLHGAKRMLAQRAIRFIYAEVGFTPQEAENQYFNPLDTFLTEYGYKLCGLYEIHRNGDHKQFIGYCNALYALQ